MKILSTKNENLENLEIFENFENLSFLKILIFVENFLVGKFLVENFLIGFFGENFSKKNVRFFFGFFFQNKFSP